MDQQPGYTRDWNQHYYFLGILYLVFGALGVIGGILAFMVIAGVGFFSGSIAASGITAIIATVVLVITILTSLPGLIIGYGLIKRWCWVRIPTIIIGILNLPGFPFGTILGIYTLWLFLNDESNRYYRSICGKF